ADTDIDSGEMCVTGREPVAVVDLDHLAIAAIPSGRDDGAAGGRMDGVAGGAAHIEAGMHRRPAQERVGAHAETGTVIERSGDRLAYGNSCECARIAVNLAAGDGDAIYLPVEDIGIWPWRF